MARQLDQIETARLFATRLALSDYDDLCRLHRDPLVMRTLSADGGVLPDAATRAGLLAGIDHWRQHGFGLWALRDQCGTFIGRGGLKTYLLAEGPVVGLAYAILSSHWNRGFATEIARASVQVGFEYLALDQIDSWTLPDNLASQRVLAKLGFSPGRDFEFAGLAHRRFRLRRPP